MKHLLALVVASVLATACGRDPNEDDAKKLLTVDPDLTLSTVFGGDVRLAVGYDCKTVSGPVTATARATVLATQSTPTPEHICSSNSTDCNITANSSLRFIVTIPASAFDTTAFGSPAVVPITISADCDGRPAISQPFTITYVQAVRGGLAPSGVSRVWASDNADEFLACDGVDLVRYSLQPLSTDLTVASPSPIELERYTVGFACTLGEMRGDVGGRRYFVVDDGGIAAIDPGPAVSWTRRDLLFQAMSATTDDDPLIAYADTSGGKHVRVLDKDDGTNLLADALPTTNTVLGPVAYDADGNISVLTYARDSADNIYYLERFDAAGLVLETREIIHYGISDLPIADFSYDGSKLYISDHSSDDYDTRWVSSVATSDGTKVQLTQASDGYRIVLGEAYGRLLVASDDAFVWVDPVNGGVTTQSFAPDSGNSFFRLRVEADGSIAMLADPSGTSAAGFYVFAPDGTSVVRLHTTDTSFGWLTSSLDGGSIVTILDPTGNEIQELGSRTSFSQ